MHADFDGNLYYIERGQNRVSRVTYTGNNAPTITQDPLSQLVSAGHPVTFAVAASGQAPLAYQWQRNHVDIDFETDSSYTLDPVALADDGDQFRCVVSNGSGNATSADAVLSVTTNQPPTATILLPTTGTTYGGGDVVDYSGSATDPETGSLTGSAFTWWVNFHHDTHFHPFLPPTTGSTGGSITIPTIGETSANVWYRIHVQVVDPFGLTDEKYVDVLPRTTTMTLTTAPVGLQLTLDGQPFTSPMDVVGVEGIQRALGAPSPQSPGGDTYDFVSWSDGGAQNHTISTPVDDTTYTAVFSNGSGTTATVSSISPGSGPGAGGTAVAIGGTDFLDGAGVTIGGSVAGSATVVGPTQITATTPVLPAGALYDVRVTNPGSLTGTLVDGWFADFADVPQSSIFHNDIETIFRGGVTGGCGTGIYCPASLVTRAQMAVFILKGEHGGAYAPPACSATVFADVPCPGGPFVDWVNQLATEGITGGCGGGDYCPLSPMTRAQMAVFLLKGEHGGGYAPPACSATVFADVSCPGGPFVDWVNQLAAEGVTVGCGGGNYCPAAGTPREQMATFLVRTFGLAGPSLRRPKSLASRSPG